MTVRLLLLPILLIALFAMTSSPARSELPQAPAPRAKKTTAELLTGTWKEIKFMNKKPLGENLLGFTADGRYLARLTSPRLGLRITTGSYTLNGKAIRLTSDANQAGPSRSWDVVIEAISPEELTLVAGPPDDRQRSVLKRVPEQRK